MKNFLYTFEDDLANRLKDPDFRKEWQAAEAEFLLAKEIIKKRLAKKMSQRELAKKVNTSQAAISRIESMNANPSLSLLKRIATALGTSLNLQINP